MRAALSVMTLGTVVWCLATEAQAQVPFGSGPSEEYFIGVQCSPVPEFVRRHFLENQPGLLVQEVVPESPAAKAGIESGAVLLRVGDQPLRSTQELRRAIQQSQGKPLTLLIWQKGKKQEVQVTPAKRRHFVPVPGGFPLGPSGRQVPKDVHIHIERHPDGKISIRVRRGDQTWEATADTLERLPAEVRSWVGAVARRLSAQGRPGPWPFDWQPFPLLPPGGRFSGFPEGPSPAPGPEVMDQLQQLRRQLQRLQEQLEQLRHQVQNLRKG